MKDLKPTCSWVLLFFLLVSMCTCWKSSSSQDSKHQILRYKRQASPNRRVFVIPRELQNTGGQLFSVAVDRNALPKLTYRLANGTSNVMNISIDPNSGIVSKTSNFGQSLGRIDFEVEVLENDIVTLTIPITIHIISRSLDDPIFGNKPQPMWAVCPEWIRPGTVIYTLQALDLKYGATDIVYNLESGGDGKFRVDPQNGEVSIVGRQQFELGKIYTLLVSAQSQGMKLPSATVGYSQSLNIKIGVKEPQFYMTPYNVTFFENATSNSIIGMVEAISFQNLPLTFSMVPSSDLFTLEGQGSLRLSRQLTWALDLRQYFFNITVQEGFTSFTTTTTLVITLLSINHAPVFPAPNHIRTNISENLPLGSELLTMVVRDYDPGAMGILTLETTNDNFKAELNNNGLVSLKLAKALDYESVVNGLYDFQVLAKDGGDPPMTGTATVQIWVTNENNKAPVFEPPNQSITVREGAGPNLLLFYVQAYDPDGDGITFTLNDANPSEAYFSVDRDTGAVTLKRAIVAGQNISSFNLSIAVSDDGSCCTQRGDSHQTNGFVAVNVYRVNTQPTFPDCKSYAPKVTEDQVVNDPITILNMTAKDTDIGPNGELVFQIFGDENTFFQVVQSGPRTAYLQLKSSTNRDARNVRKFNDTFKLPVTVSVRDKGIPTLTSYCLLFVTIETINKNAPTVDYINFDSFIYIPDLQVNQRLARVFAYDLDYGANGQVTYSKNSVGSDDYCSNMAVDEQTGWILWRGAVGTAEIPEIEKFLCQFHATDNGIPSKTTGTTVTFIFKNDIGYKPPLWRPLNGFQIDDTEISIFENAAKDSIVASLSAYSNSINASIEFFLPSEGPEVFNGRANFEAKPMSGMNISIRNELPEANLRSEYFLRCRAFYNGFDKPLPIGLSTGPTNLARLRVKVKDVNNQVPEFLGRDSNGIYVAAVTQYSRNGDYVVTVTAVDMDKDWPNNKVTYSLQNPSEYFSIDETNGEIKVSSTKNPIFDPDVRSMYELIVVATDGAPSSITGPKPNNATTKVQIIVSGGTLGNPYFTRNFTESLDEGKPRFTNVTTVQATIPKSPSGGMTSIVRYNIQQGNALRNFAVDPDTGRIYTVRPVLRSMAQSYQLTYAVFNGLKNNLTYVTITINEAMIYPPSFTSNIYSYSGTPITEKNHSYVGTKLATVSASKGRSAITYTTSDASRFGVNDLGEVRLAKALSRDSPDGFAPQQVTIVASDGSNPPAYAVLTLDLMDINDHMPLFDTCCTKGYVDENSAAAVSVMQLKAWDADFKENGTVVYSIVEDPSGKFSVSQSGAVSVNGPLDFEGKQKYSVKINATDMGTPRPLSSQTTVDIFVRDVSLFPPNFAQGFYMASAPEELPVATSVFSVRATDNDTMDRLVYSISNIGASNDGSFFYVETLQAFNGSYETSTAQRVATAVIRIAQRIDYDATKKSNYSFQLQVRDSTSLQAQTTVLIQITDVNDNPPVFSEPQKNATLAEDVGIGTPVATFSATDIDSGDNGKFSYSVDYEQSDPRFMFQVDPTSGQVTVRSQLDYEWRPKMAVKILAIDQGTPPMTGTATLSVTVLNADESAPALRNKLPADPIAVPINSNIGQQVHCLSVYNPDDANNNNNNFNYQLDCTGLFSERCKDFNISQTGCLITTRDDYSKLPYDSYIIPVKVTKKTGSQKSTIEVIGLTLKNQAPGPPAAGEKKVTAMNYVGANGGFSAMPLGSVYAVDSDVPDKMSYSIDPTLKMFYLDAAKGQIWLRGNATAGEQVAKVRVVNNKYPNQPVDSEIKVNLKHVNESVLKAATSLRIIGLRDASDLLQPTGQGTVLDTLTQKIGEIVGGNSVIEILSIWTAPSQNSSQPVVDVLYAVHGSPYYSAEKLSALVWAARSDIFQKTKLNVIMSPVDLCKSEFYNCWDQGCETRLEVDESKPQLVNANRNSFVGVTAVFRQVCSCPGRTSPDTTLAPVQCSSTWCFNGGSCVLNNSAISCLCPAGFEGRRCQKTKVSIRDGYILLPPLSSCEIDHLSFEFLSSTDSPQNALLLYNGPTSDPGPSKGTYEEVTSPTYQSRDFLLLELANGKPKLRIDLGDGEFNLGFETSSLASLNDGKWHSIDIIHSGREVRLVLDKCGKATLAENISSSTMDTSNCEAKATAPLQRFLLNTVAPLQLGGRWDSDNQYPTGWTRDKFRGCFRNLQHNGETYDLSLGSWRQYSNAQDSCPSDSCNSCPPSATCLPNVILGTSICQCPPGFRGDKCDVRTTVKYFNENGFAQWETTDEFRTALNSSYLQSFWFADRIDLSFRTRQKNGVLFMAQSFTGLERYLLEVKNSAISLASDMGSGDIILTLPNVNVSDGGWHRIQIIRYGNMVEMHLDTGEGLRYNASLPTNQHRLLRIKSASVLGHVVYNEWRKELTVSKSLGKSCITDVRYGGYWWPLSEVENSEPKVTARVTLKDSSDTGCSVGACPNEQCPANMICVDLWQATQCICKNYTISPAPPNDQCLAKSCLTSPCQNGATCVFMDNQVTCVCPPGWYGAVCSSLRPKNDESISSRDFNLAAAIALPIIFGLLLLLLIALLIWYCCCRKKRDGLLYDEPDKDIRDNVIVYDDEGAGEEDNYGFDLSQLQRSSPLEVESLRKNPDLLELPAFGSRAGAGQPMPGDYPSIEDFIANKLNDIDNDPETLLDDSRANFLFEGRGSLAGSLSSLASSEGDRDADFDWLEDVGPRFGRLADLYGEGGQV